MALSSGSAGKPGSAAAQTGAVVPIAAGCRSGSSVAVDISGEGETLPWGQGHPASISALKATGELSSIRASHLLLRGNKMLNIWSIRNA